jgi:hypothetical protein
MVAGAPVASSGAYTEEETAIVNQALRTHRDTTQAAERALKVRRMMEARSFFLANSHGLYFSSSALITFTHHNHRP